MIFDKLNAQLVMDLFEDIYYMIDNNNNVYYLTFINYYYNFN